MIFTQKNNNGFGNFHFLKLNTDRTATPIVTYMHISTNNSNKWFDIVLGEKTILSSGIFFTGIDNGGEKLAMFNLNGISFPVLGHLRPHSVG